jgi:phage terminase large subunit-like protein
VPPAKGWPPRWQSPVPPRSKTKGDLARQFIEEYAVIVKDSIAGSVGEKILLRPWQRRLVNNLLATKPDGTLKHRSALIGMPRKNGKSALLSGLALYSLYCGDDGGEVYSVAGDREQARITFGAARRMIEMNAELSSMSRVFRDAIEFTSTGSVWRVLSSDAPLKEGLSPTMVLVDEVHVINEDLWNVMALAGGSRKEPLMVGITTAGARTNTLGQETIAYRLYQYGQRVASGEVVDPTFYFAWWEPKAGSDADHRNPKVWAESNPGYGDIVAAADFESTVNRTAEAEFRTKRTNVWVVSNEAALPHGAWERLEEPRDVSRTEPIVIGFDGSYVGDSTAIVGCTADGYLFVLDAWERPPDDEHWRVPIADVETRLVQLCRTYNVREVVCDPFRWQRSMQVLADDGLPIVEWPTNAVARIVPAWQRFYDAVMDEQLHHDGDVRLARHMSNMVLKRDNRGARPTKESKMSGRKIDLGIAAIIAYDRASRAPEESVMPGIIEW